MPTNPAVKDRLSRSYSRRYLGTLPTVVWTPSFPPLNQPTTRTHPLTTLLIHPNGAEPTTVPAKEKEGEKAKKIIYIKK